MIPHHTATTLGLLALLLLAAACDDPGEPEITQDYRWGQDGTPSAGERGNMLINEIHYAGSVTDEGVWDKDDVFIELWNKHPRPINPSGWRLEVSGEVHQAYRIPPVEEPIPPNGYFVIAAKPDGAFADVADVFIEDLELGKSRVHVELRDFDRKLMESAGHEDARVFAGGYDLVTARSMERSQIIFGNRGESATNWHAYTTDLDDEHDGTVTVREGWRDNTLASPGLANSRDYTGNTSSGNFE